MYTKPDESVSRATPLNNGIVGRVWITASTFLHKWDNNSVGSMISLSWRKKVWRLDRIGY